MPISVRMRPVPCHNPLGFFGLLLADKKALFVVMNNSDIIRFSSALMQFGVACYALRLGRIFNTARVGWVVFSTLSLLAVLYFLVPTSLLNGFIPLGIKVDLVYALVSVVLILGMIYLDVSSKQRRQSEKAERKAQLDFEAQVDTKWAVLTKANQELRESTARMTAELDEQKRARELAEKAVQEQTATARQVEDDLRQTISKLQVEASTPKPETTDLKPATAEADQALQAKSLALEEQLTTARNQLVACLEQFTTAQEQLTDCQNQLAACQNQLADSQKEVAANQDELDASRGQLTALRASEDTLRATIAGLEASLAEQKRAQEELEKTRQEMLLASRQTGITEAASNVLPHVANVLESLNSVSLSAQDLAQSSMDQVSRIGKLMREHSRLKRLPAKRHPLDRQLRECLTLLSRRLSDEQLQLARQIGVVKRKVGELKGSVAGNDAITEVAARQVAVTAETVTETATTTALVEESASVQGEETATPQIAETPVQIEEPTPIQVDEPVQFDGGVTLENYHDMTVSSIDLGDHLLSNMTHTGTESAQNEDVAAEEKAESLDQTEVRSDT
jgi:chromosome segregation ATPase